MTPATWSFVELLMTRMTFPPSLPGYRGYGRIGGRFYANVSMSISLEALVGISPRRFAALFGPILGKLPPIEEIPRPRLPRWKAIRLTVPATVAMLRRVNASQKRMPQFLADAPSRCERLRAEIGQTTDATVLASLWPEKVRPLVEEACDMLAAAGTHGTTLLSIPGKLANAGRRGRLGPAALRPAGRGTRPGQSRPGYRPRPARPGRDRPGHLRPPVRTPRLPRGGAVDPAAC